MAEIIETMGAVKAQRIGRRTMILALTVVSLSALSLVALVTRQTVCAAVIGGLLAVTSLFLALRLRAVFSPARKKSLLYENMFDSLPCWATLLDRNLNVLRTNDLFKKDFGEENGKKCHRLYFGSDSPCDDCVADKSFKNGEVTFREHSLTTSDGRTVNAIMYGAPVRDEKAEIVAVVELGVDVTDVKEMQRNLALLGLTISGMAHSIKNIMMGLDGGIYVVGKGLESGDDAEVKEGWDIVLLNFDKVSRLVQDILYCSKEREPNFQPVKPNDVIREVHDLFKDTARSYEIELKLELDDKVGETLMDPKGLHAVLSNLVTNAIDACKADIWQDDNEVILRSKKAADGSTIIEVADDGIGMERETQGNAMEDFFTTKGQQGTGLGLMVTQKILKEHGGAISFRSRPRKGTTFTAVFPAREVEQSLDGTE